MRDDISELILKLGKYPSVYNGKIKRVIDKNNKIFQSNYVPYTISMCNNSLFTIDTTKNITPMEYNGHVYCVTVPSHVIYVRRNGNSCWCGNSGQRLLRVLKKNEDQSVTKLTQICFRWRKNESSGSHTRGR